VPLGSSWNFHSRAREMGFSSAPDGRQSRKHPRLEEMSAGMAGRRLSDVMVVAYGNLDALQIVESNGKNEPEKL
jgi:hypothetical protein